MLRPFRLIGIVFVILSFMLTMAVVRLIVRGRWRQVFWSSRILSRYSQACLWVLNIKSTYRGEEFIQDPEGILFVGNHLTYVDVLVISARVSACFVTSTEIKESLGLGQICIMAGCLFVERRNKMNILSEVSEITRGLEHGLNVAIFPESTSTNGEQVLRFRKPLFVGALACKAPIIPFCLNYRRVGRDPISRQTRDKIFWYGDMDFIPHMWALAGSGGVDVELTFLPPIFQKEAEEATSVVQRAQAAVESVFFPVK